MIDNIRLSELPPYGKLFVALFTTLMLLVGVWAAFIYYVEKGMVDTDHLPAYLDVPEEAVTGTDEEEFQEDLHMQEDAAMLAEDSGAVLAPIWDTNFAGLEVHVDSLSNIEHFRQVDEEMEAEAREYGYDGDYDRPYDVDETGEARDLRRNVGLAHTHINGQTLLFFAIGLVFLFTSAPPRTKKIVYWLFGISVFLHAVGLSGEGYHWLFDDILAISGVAIVVVIVHMALLIYVDLAKKSTQRRQ